MYCAVINGLTFDDKKKLFSMHSQENNADFDDDGEYDAVTDDEAAQGLRRRRWQQRHADRAARDRMHMGRCARLGEHKGMPWQFLVCCRCQLCATWRRNAVGSAM